jgi:WD40 repeat protein
VKPYAKNGRLLVFAALALGAAVCVRPRAAARPSHTGMVMALAFSPDDRALFVTRDHDVTLRSVADGRAVRTFRGHLAVVTSLAVSGDGKTLLTSSEDGAVKLWGVETGRLIRELAEGTPGDDSNYEAHVNVVALSPDGRLAAAGANSGEVTLWDVSTGRALRKLREEPRASIQGLTFSARGGSLLTADGLGRVVRWDAATGRKIKSFVDDPISGIDSLSVSADGSRVLTVSGLKIRLWDAASGKKLLAFSELGEEYYTPRCASFAPDGTTAVSGDDSRVYVWDLKTGARLRTFKDPSFSHVESLAVSHRGEFAAAGDIFGNVRVWRYATGEPLWPEERRGVGAEAE